MGTAGVRAVTLATNIEFIPPTENQQKTTVHTLDGKTHNMADYAYIITLKRYRTLFFLRERADYVVRLPILESTEECSIPIDHKHVHLTSLFCILVMMTAI